MCKPDARYQDAIVITDRTLVEGDFLRQIARVLNLAPHALILREKDLCDADYEALARRVLRLCEDAEVPCFLHGRIDIARKLGCRRIHLPLAELKRMESIEKSSREKREAEKYTPVAGFSVEESHPCWQDAFDEISVSCHSMEDMQQAVTGGATQIILGTIFETDCKPGRKGSGLPFVRDIAAACPVPIYAIGGITLERLQLVKAAGAAGACMMSAFMKFKSL